MNHKLNIQFLLVMVVMCASCATIRNSNTHSNPPEFIKQDVILKHISDTFYYERSVNANYDLDAIVQSPIFVLGDDSTIKYSEGIFSFDYGLSKDSLIQDSINKYLNRNLLNFFYMDIQMVDTQKSVNPFCGSYYDKYVINGSFLLIGMTQRVLPNPIDCDSIAKSKKVEYFISKYVPVFLIMDIESYRSIE